jgi:hypothetical protein
MFDFYNRRWAYVEVAGAQVARSHQHFLYRAEGVTECCGLADLLRQLDTDGLPVALFGTAKRKVVSTPPRPRPLNPALRPRLDPLHQEAIGLAQIPVTLHRAMLASLSESAEHILFTAPIPTLTGALHKGPINDTAALPSSTQVKPVTPTSDVSNPPTPTTGSSSIPLHTPTPPPTGKPWPAGLFMCEVASGFAAMDRLGRPNTVAQKFTRVFGCPYRSATYYDNRKIWTDATTEDREHYVAAGKTDAGRWSCYDQMIRLFQNLSHDYFI